MEPHVLSGFRRIMKKNKYMLICFCMLAVAGLIAGCTNTNGNLENVEEKEAVKIPVIFTVSPQNGNKSNQELVEAFNEEYQGQYEIEVDWIMETEEEYRKNLKRQNVTDTMPAVITDLRLLPSFYQMVIEDKRVMDLSEYMESDAEWKEMIEPSVLECFEEEDGSMYLAPISTAIFSCSGMFWNEELFAKAGIYEFPKTWDEFWVCCDRLEACGIAPLALHTEGTAWAPMLITSAALADTEEGAAFMKELFPDSYQNENGMTMADTLTKLFSYTTADALHNDFDVSFDNFFSGKAAMIPNGYWMIEQIPEEWKDKVRFSAFPGNKMVSSPETFGWAVVDSYSEEVKEGAVEFLKFRTEYNLREKEKLLNYGGARKMRVLTDYVNAYLGEPQIVPNYQTKWNSIFQEKTLGEYLPELVTGKITAEEFLEAADASIAAYKLEH